MLVDEIVLISRHALQDSLLKQGFADRHKSASLCRRAQCELVAQRSQGGRRGQLHHAFPRQFQCDLRIGAFQHGTRQAEQHLAVPIVRRQAARIVGQVCRSFEQSRAFTTNV